MRRGRVAAVVVAVLVLGWVGGLWWAHPPVEVVPLVVAPACPPLLQGVPDATDDYGDTVEWQGTTYWRTDREARAGRRVGAVACSISDLPNPDGWRVAPDGWPDGTATVLPRGTTLHLPRETRSRPALVARTGDGDVLYCPDVADGPPTC